MTRCQNCSYFWRDDDEPYAHCHYAGPEDWAPCNFDDEQEEGDDNVW